MTDKITINITDQTGRIDAILANQNLPYSRTVLANWVQSGEVLVIGQRVKRSYKVTAGDVISIQPPVVQPTEIVAEAMPLDIVQRVLDELDRFWQIKKY